MKFSEFRYMLHCIFLLLFNCFSQVPSHAQAKIYVPITVTGLAHQFATKTGWQTATIDGGTLCPNVGMTGAPRVRLLVSISATAKGVGVIYVNWAPGMFLVTNLTTTNLPSRIIPGPPSYQTAFRKIEVPVQVGQQTIGLFFSRDGKGASTGRTTIGVNVSHTSTPWVTGPFNQIPFSDLPCP